jgi:choline-glycine betaine transporter
VQANAFILVTAIFLDAVVLGALLWIKAQSDMMVIYAAIVGMIAVFAGERWFLNGKNNS